nr:immunoglobulin heavy chain junction region [Macaca mulatta]
CANDWGYLLLYW